MDVPEFEDLLGRHGGDLSHWPTDRQAAAEALLKSSKQARVALAEAQRLRRVLQPTQVRAPAGLVDRIMGKIRRLEGNPADENTTNLDESSAPPKD
ncbi:hypothetical protein IVB30_23875 [Bradyrhizobium sp. 200]|nr:hypothetical protein IVB30_23875 [Bradyrhizobium sp. 200]